MSLSPDGAADNLSRKRAAFRQLNKDDDVDAEEEEERTSVTGTGTFKKASDEVLASRRIVKVRRAAPAPASSAPNPFASISLVPPSELVAQPEAPGGNEVHKNDATEGQMLQKNHNSTVNHFVDTQFKADEKPQEAVADQLDSTPTTKGTTQNGENERIQREENGRKCPEETDKTLEVSTEKKEPVKNSLSFQQHSFSKNAFSGSFGTGFSTSSFSFGVTPSSAFASPVGFGFFGSSGSLASTHFGSSLSTEDGGSSFLGKSSSGTAAPFQLFSSEEEPETPVNSGRLVQPVVSLSEVPVETGEEKDKVVFSADSILFEFVDKAWKERGKGELKVNVSEDTDGKARLVMRSKGNLRLLLNANLFPDMHLNRMDNKSITFACANSASTLKVGGLTTYALKFRDSSIAENFKSVIEVYKVSSLENHTRKGAIGSPKENENHTEEVQNTSRRPVESIDSKEPEV